MQTLHSYTPANDMKVTKAIVLVATTVVGMACMASANPELVIEKLLEVPEAECTVMTKTGDQIEMHYKGTLEDGTEFDQSYKRGSPLPFKLGAGHVIKGWDQGLLDMCIGEKRKLTIPSHLAYGERGYPGLIPGGATLVFEAELVSINSERKSEL
eukprot:CFRG3211T1